MQGGYSKTKKARLSEQNKYTTDHIFKSPAYSARVKILANRARNSRINLGYTEDSAYNRMQHFSHDSLHGPRSYIKYYKAELTVQRIDCEIKPSTNQSKRVHLAVYHKYSI